MLFVVQVEYLWVPGSFLEQVQAALFPSVSDSTPLKPCAGLPQDGQQYMEVTEHGIIEVIPVKVEHNCQLNCGINVDHDCEYCEMNRFLVRVIPAKYLCVTTCWPSGCPYTA
jgi:hypothetical protein